MSFYRPRPPNFSLPPRPNEYPPTLQPLQPPMPTHFQSQHFSFHPQLAPLFPPLPLTPHPSTLLPPPPPIFPPLPHTPHPITLVPLPPSICPPLPLSAHPSTFILSPPSIWPPFPFSPHLSTIIIPPPSICPPLPFSPQPSTFIPPPLPICPPLTLTPHPSTIIPPLPPSTLIPPPPPDVPCPPTPPPPEYPYSPSPPPPELPCIASPILVKEAKVKSLKSSKNHELENSIHGKSSKPQLRETNGDYKELVPVSVGQIRMSERTSSFWSRKNIENRLRKPTDFVCTMKFRNELPDITRECKILPLKRDPERFTRYDAAAEKKLWKPEIHPEADLGIPLDLLDMSVYNPPKGERIPLDPEDEELLRDDDDDDDLVVAATPAFKNNGLKIKSRPDDQSVPWLVKRPKTQYISPINTMAIKRHVAKRENVEVLQRLGARNKMKNIYDRERKIKEIEASFEACKSLPVHSTNKELQPVEVLPLLPDFERLINHQFVAASFDSHPTGDSEAYNKLDESVRETCESKAIMKCCVVKDSKSAEERFLDYFVPAPNEISKDINDEEGVLYSRIREYNYNVLSNEVDDPKSFIVSLDNNEARYVPLQTKLKMRKKKASKGTASDMIVRRRPLERTAVLEREKE